MLKEKQVLHKWKKKDSTQGAKGGKIEYRLRENEMKTSEKESEIIVQKN